MRSAVIIVIVWIAIAIALLAVEVGHWRASSWPDVAAPILLIAVVVSHAVAEWWLFRRLVRPLMGRSSRLPYLLLALLPLGVTLTGMLVWTYARDALGDAWDRWTTAFCMGFVGTLLAIGWLRVRLHKQLQRRSKTEQFPRSAVENDE